MPLSLAAGPPMGAPMALSFPLTALFGVCVLMQAPRAMLLPLALALLASVTSAYQLPAARGANSCTAGAARSGLAVRMDATEDRIKELIDENKIMLFMKGNKMFPQCGFSNTAVMSKRSLINDRTRLSLAFLIRLP